MALGGLATLLCEGNSFSILARHVFATICAWVPTTAAAVLLLLGAVHAMLSRWCRRCPAASLEQQLVTCLHALFALVYAIQIVPYTYLVCRVLFGQDLVTRWAGRLGGRGVHLPAAAANCVPLLPDEPSYTCLIPLLPAVC